MIGSAAYAGGYVVRGASTSTTARTGFPVRVPCTAAAASTSNAQHVCFGAIVAHHEAGGVVLLGYVGLANGPLTGARVQLLAGQARLSFTGEDVLSDNAGHFGFVWTGRAAATRFAFRFEGTPAYGAAASAIVTP